MPLEWDLASLSGTSYDADGFLTAQPSTFDDEGAQGYEAHHPLGFFARPRDPSDDGAPNVLTALEGNRGHAWILGDPRVSGGLPAMQPGGAVMYAALPAGNVAFSYLAGHAGIWQTLVPYASTACSVAIDTSTEGQESICLDHGAGMGLSLVAGGKYAATLRNRDGSAWLACDDDGVTISTPTAKIVGAVVLGTQTPAAAQSFAMSAPLAAWMAQVAAWMASAATACAAKGITLPAPPAAPAGLASTMAKGL